MGASRAVSSSFLLLENVTKIYRSGQVEQRAVQEVTLELDRGQFLGIMGPSGCGKSTLLNLIGGLDDPTSGRILLDGRDFSSMSDEEITLLRRDRIGMVFQFFNLLPHLTALENAALPLYMVGAPIGEADEKARELLDFVGLAPWERHLPSQLSGGQQQRVAIARSLVRGPELLLADEPTGNLDSENSREVMRLFERVCSESRLTIILVTHQEQVVSSADRVVRMRDGMVL
ncbi:MAG: ABC transporter ATP-binding protein [Deltaproteobacteria bacterium]|nr:ABC transporter ATP-binding protein [Deltaproteobacteria bacterium]